MTPEHPEADEKPKALLMDIASTEDFGQTKISSILEISDTLEFYKLETDLQGLAKTAEDNDDLAAYRAYRVLMVICSYHFSIDRADAFTPKMIMGNKRTLIPSDFLGEQTDILSQIAHKIDHPLLRARVADICWYNSRKLYQLAELAAESYCSAVEDFFNDKLSYSYEGELEVPSKIIDLIERAFQIMSRTGKKEIPDFAKNIWHYTHDKAKANKNAIAYNRLSTLGQSHNLTDWYTIAIEAEQLAESTEPTDYAMAVKKVWDLAAYAYSRIKDKESENRCNSRSVDQTLKMREAVSTASAKASWTRDAIGELRVIGGMQDRIELLKKELQILEEESTSEFGQFSIPIDLTEERKDTINRFNDLSISDMLFQLAFIDRIPEKIGLHARCLKKRDNHFISSTFGKSYADHKGKVIATVPALNLSEKPPEEWYDHESLTELSLHYHIAVQSAISPACITIIQNFAIDDRHIVPITSASPFVPPGHESIFALGFARLIQGDMMSACHILIPQLENSIRYVLNNNGKNTARMNKDLTQEDQSLSLMYNNRKQELEEVFGIDTIYLIHLLFNLKGGPMLRHEMAHGKLSAGTCFLSSSIYACWLIYFLTCAPLYSHWDSHIAKNIEHA